MKRYSVARLHRPLRIDAKWDKYPWNEIPSLDLDHYMGEKPDHIPGVHAKLAYDDEAIYAIFRCWVKWSTEVFVGESTVFHGFFDR